MKEKRARSLGGEDRLEEEIATCSSIIAWKIPWIGEFGGLHSMGLQRSWTRLGTHEHLHEKKKQAFKVIFCDCVGMKTNLFMLHMKTF